MTPLPSPSIPGLNELRQAATSRAGYFALTKDEAARPSPEERLDREVRANDSVAEFPKSVTLKQLKSSNGTPELSVTVHVDLPSLEFQPQKDRQVQQLNFVVALYDSAGEFIVGKQGEIDLALKPDSFTRLLSTGINSSLNLIVPGAANSSLTTAPAPAGANNSPEIGASTRTNGPLNAAAFAGDYRLRVVAQEAITGKLSPSTQPVHIPESNRPPSQ